MTMNTRKQLSDAIVELEIDVQRATIEQTGEEPEPGPMAMVSAIGSTLAEDGDIDLALEMLLSLQRTMRDDEMEMM